MQQLEISFQKRTFEENFPRTTSMGRCKPDRSPYAGTAKGTTAGHGVLVFDTDRGEREVDDDVNRPRMAGRHIA